jgi:neocarzinostatin family protein
MTVLEEIDVRSRMSKLSRVLAAVAALVVVLVTAPPSFAAPTLNISQTEGLSNGQTVTISGSGFEANLSSIAIGQCIEGYVGPADCNTAGGAVFKNADAQGNVASFDIKVSEVFGGHDCTKVQCVIAGAPLPTNADEATIAANTYSTKISFGAAAPAAPTEPEASETVASDAGSLPKTGAGDSVPVLLLGASALLAAGVGLVLLVPGRRRGEHA